MKKNRGFTIIELLVMVALIGIIVMVASTVSESIRLKSRIAGVVNNFISDFNRAKILAAAENRYVAFVFNPNGSSYDVLKQQLIGDLNTGNWTRISRFNPTETERFFETATVESFAVNSLGEIRKLPLVANSMPVSIQQVFSFNWHGNGYSAIMTIQAYGGLKIEKKNVPYN